MQYILATVALMPAACCGSPESRSPRALRWRTTHPTHPCKPHDSATGLQPAATSYRDTFMPIHLSLPCAVQLVNFILQPLCAPVKNLNVNTDRQRMSNLTMSWIPMVEPLTGQMPTERCSNELLVFTAKLCIISHGQQTLPHNQDAVKC